MARVLAIVPFFGGTSSATHSLEETRLGYLEQTRESLKREFSDVYIVTYQSRKDKVRVPDSFLLGIDPIWLPYAACIDVQKTPFDEEYVLYTEADQVWHVHDEAVLDVCDDETYLAPWRLDAVGPNGECELPDSAQLQIDGVTYAVANGGHRIPKDGGDQWDFIDFHANQSAFSGAWVATAAYFQRIPFRKMKNLPVEHASGFDAKSIGTCVKTNWVERCWVDHLSPRDRWQPPAEESAN